MDSKTNGISTSWPLSNILCLMAVTWYLCHHHNRIQVSLVVGDGLAHICNNLSDVALYIRRVQCNDNGLDDVWCAILIAHQLLWQNMEAPVFIFQESPLAGEHRERLFHIPSVHRYQLSTKYLYSSTSLWLRLLRASRLYIWLVLKLQVIILVTISRLWRGAGLRNRGFNFLCTKMHIEYSFMPGMWFRVSQFYSKITKIYHYSMESSVRSVCFCGDFTIKTVHAQKFVWKMRHTLKHFYFSCWLPLLFLYVNCFSTGVL